MAPNEFFVRLQKGITGGFAPPTPSEIHVLTLSPQHPTVLAVDSQVRPDGTPELQSLNAQPKQVPLDHSSNQALVEELHGILKGLPTEQPSGSEDIYGLDTSIMWGSEDLQWQNGGPAGCSGGNSSVKATSEDKKKFERAVEIVKELATQ